MAFSATDTSESPVDERSREWEDYVYITAHLTTEQPDYDPHHTAPTVDPEIQELDSCPGLSTLGKCLFGTRAPLDERSVPLGGWRSNAGYKEADLEQELQEGANTGWKTIPLLFVCCA